MTNVFEFINIQPHYVCTTKQFVELCNSNEIEQTPEKKQAEENKLFNLVDNRHFDLISDTARKKIQKAVEYMMYLTKSKKLKGKYDYKISMLTLTLPADQTHTHADIKKFALNQMITELKSDNLKTENGKTVIKWKAVERFMWKTELQRNGNIHFHIIVDEFIDKDEVRRVWNRILNKGKVKGCKVPFDYVDRYREKRQQFFKAGFRFDKNQKRSLSKQKQSFARELRKPEYTPDAKLKDQHLYRWSDPNSTDIHSTRNSRDGKEIRNLAAYLGKYLSKGIEKEQKSKAERIHNLKTAKIDCIFAIQHHEKKIYEYQQDKRRIKGSTAHIDGFIQIENHLIEKLTRELKIIHAALDALWDNCMQGRLWFLSQGISKFLKGAKSEITQDCYSEIEQLEKVLEAMQEESGRTLMKKEDFFTVYLVRINELRKLGFKRIAKIFDDFITETKNSS